MKITLNGTPLEIEPETRLIALVDQLEERVKNDPMIISLIQKTGKSNLLFILNGAVVKAEDLPTIEIQEGDDLRYVHPFFGG
ncbi:MAG: MoaD/ThiS family protein [Desulfobacterales bacterium]|jgi:sulfur carrier protein ThiS|nr:MoaD/ThiS family protein [Desulfobacterales bacterium]MCU0591780.1 MoaD/ThiS family protein [Desulfobacterales bacterium]MCU0602975.1 MoaD/ThiS family protein [Desulfobacterales bacterium]